MSYEVTLKKVLESKNDELYGRLLAIERITKSLLSYTHGKFPFYTPHGYSHSLAVEDHLNWIIHDDLKEKLDVYEIFFVIVAAWMHDWGMVGKVGENPEQIRKIHHLRTEKCFEKMYKDLFLSEHEGRIIGRICRGHTKEDLYSKQYDDVVIGHNHKIRCRFLAATLRLADECDIDYNRTPEIIYHSINPIGKSEEEFKKHLDVCGVGQLDEKHKIYINAIARDPKGAKTLRMVKDKIQNELDNIKGILLDNNIVLDVVELRLVSKGFIDKPIGLGIDKKNIVELLIGEHLYKSRDVAIRELVQNSIDSCLAKKELDGYNFIGKIILSKPDENTIEIEDNGIGMDYSSAKRFLSTIGASYYKSDEFKQLIQEKKFDPIAKFGIGLLSCFLLAESLSVETKKEGEAPCKFTILSPEEEWRFEKGSLQNSGTKITLNLNNYGKKIKIIESLENYFIAPEVDIFYQKNKNIIKFESSWSSQQIIERFCENYGNLKEEKITDLLIFENKNFNTIILQSTLGFLNQLVIFNHGIFVGSFNLHGLNFNLSICVNLKKDIIDLEISREDIVHNDRYSEFIYLLFSKLIEKIEHYHGKNLENYISNIKFILGSGRSYLTKEPESSFSKQYPMLRAILDSIKFPVFYQGQLTLKKINELKQEKRLNLYHVYSSNPMKEINLILKYLSKENTILFNPYRLTKIEFQSNTGKYSDLLLRELETLKVKFLEFDLNKLLLDLCSKTDEQYTDIIPNNVFLRGFPLAWNPIVLIKEKPKVKSNLKTIFGISYWGNTILWKNLIEAKETIKILESLGEHNRSMSKLHLIKEPVVFVNLNDPLINRIINARKKMKLNNELSGKICRYFKYLTYLPLVFSNISSTIIFLEILDTLEKEISNELGLKNEKPLLLRMKPNCKLYYDYFDGLEKEGLYVDMST